MRNEKGQFVKGSIPTNAFSKGHIPWMKGKHPSEEVLEKIRQAHLGMSCLEETKQKLREYHTGKHHTEETKIKIGLTQLGEKNVNWKGGITPENLLIRTSFEYKNWRREVYKRDYWTCQMCGNKKDIKIRAHHIKSFSKYPELRFEISNGITLCKDCHENNGFHNKILVA